MQTQTTPFRLTDAEREQYDRDGYVLREGTFTREETAEIAASCEELLERVVAERHGKRQKAGSYVFEGEGDSDVVHGLEPFAHVAPELETWAYDARFVDPMRDICEDDEPILFTEKLNLKRAHMGGVNPLHQDYPYWTEVADDPRKVATAMLFLDDATLANGCLQVVPGSHRDGVRAKRNDMDAFGNLEMDQGAFADGDPVPLEVAAGSVVFFGPFLVHMSEPNRSDGDRRSILFSYQPHGLRHMREVSSVGS
jgi:ectoine hydroxylase-related dioxygenase (phytanoyl-CoA dioxygenase family)